MSKAVVSATGSLASSMTPTRLFFRLSQKVPSINHARAVFATIGKFGDMVEYKFMRCPETQQYLRYGYIVFKHKEDAQRALTQQFLKVDADIFEKSCEIKLEKSRMNDSFRNNPNKSTSSA